MNKNKKSWYRKKLKSWLKGKNKKKKKKSDYSNRKLLKNKEF